MSERYFVAAFDSEDDVKAAVRSARQRRYCVQDVFTPYPVHGLDQAMGLRPSRLAWACLAFAIVGASTGLWLQHWTSATDWPINVGGKPFNSLPAFIPVTFELAVLFAGLGTVAALFARSGLFPGKRPFLPEPRVTDDQFLMFMAETDASFDSHQVAEFCVAHHAVWYGEWIDGHVHKFPRPASPDGPPAHADEPRSELEHHIGQTRVRLRRRAGAVVASE